MKDEYSVFEEYKRRKQEDRGALVTRMATALRERFSIQVVDMPHLKSVIEMTYDWGIMEGLQFAIEDMPRMEAMNKGEEDGSKG